MGYGAPGPRNDWEVIAVLRAGEASTSRGSTIAVRVTVPRHGALRLSYTCGFEDSQGEFRIAVHLDHRHVETFLDLLDSALAAGEETLALESFDSAAALREVYERKLEAILRAKG